MNRRGAKYDNEDGGENLYSKGRNTSSTNEGRRYDDAVYTESISDDLTPINLVASSTRKRITKDDKINKDSYNNKFQGGANEREREERGRLRYSRRTTPEGDGEDEIKQASKNSVISGSTGNNSSRSQETSKKTSKKLDVSNRKKCSPRPDTVAEKEETMASMKTSKNETSMGGPITKNDNGKDKQQQQRQSSRHNRHRQQNHHHHGRKTSDKNNDSLSVASSSKSSSSTGTDLKSDPASCSDCSCSDVSSRPRHGKHRNRHHCHHCRHAIVERRNAHHRHTHTRDHCSSSSRQGNHHSHSHQYHGSSHDHHPRHHHHHHRHECHGCQSRNRHRSGGHRRRSFSSSSSYTTTSSSSNSNCSPSEAVNHKLKSSATIVAVTAETTKQKFPTANVQQGGFPASTGGADRPAAVESPRQNFGPNASNASYTKRWDNAGGRQSAYSGRGGGQNSYRNGFSNMGAVGRRFNGSGGNDYQNKEHYKQNRDNNSGSVWEIKKPDTRNIQPNTDSGLTAETAAITAESPNQPWTETWN